MEINQFDCFRAKINYDKNNSQKEKVEGSIVFVQAMRIADKGERCEDLWLFNIARYEYDISEKDLELLEKISPVEFYKELNKPFSPEGQIMM